MMRKLVDSKVEADLSLASGIRLLRQNQTKATLKVNRSNKYTLSGMIKAHFTDNIYISIAVKLNANVR